MSGGQRAVRALEWVCLGFVALGLALPVAYSLPMFALYRAALADYLGDAALAEASPTLTWCLGMTGGSIAGKWLAHWVIVRFGLRNDGTSGRARWAWNATWAGLLSWFVLDSAASLAHGAWANVAMINGMPLLLVVPLLLAMRGQLGAATTVRPFRELRVPMRVALIASVLGMGSGVMIAALGDSALFGPLRDALGQAHFGGALPDSGRGLLRFFLGPIGGATLGQFVLVFVLVQRADVLGERRALGWALATVLLWFVFDSTISAVVGAFFNLWMVNVPALLLTAGPLGWAYATATGPPVQRRES